MSLSILRSHAIAIGHTGNEDIGPLEQGFFDVKVWNDSQFELIVGSDKKGNKRSIVLTSQELYELGSVMVAVAAKYSNVDLDQDRANNLLYAECLQT